MDNVWRESLNDFTSEEWITCSASPKDVPGNHVYVLVVENSGQSIPLYVGQTSRLAGRIGDYVAAPWSASTDFRVGEAIKYLRDKGCTLHFHYKVSSEHTKAEKDMIRDLLLSGHLLLNFLGGYDYTTAKKEDERKIVHLFCDTILKRTLPETFS
jgi:hypothetical protein